MNKKTRNGDSWLFEITPKTELIQLNLDEVWRYRDLLFLFVKRDVITVYKQTILGPLWYILQPLFTAIIFTLVFNSVAGIKTSGVPPFIFNLAGITTWNYFRECLISTSNTFQSNQGIFGKVYFPRLVLPLAIVVSNLLKFGIQLLIFTCFYLYFLFEGYDLQPNKYIVLFPFLVLIMGMLGLGLGLICSSMVTKYRDLTFLVGFGVQLLMYLSLVVLPLTLFQQKGFEWAVKYNPMAYIIEMSRFMLLDKGTVSLFGVLFTLVVSLSLLFLGIIMFNRTEKSFMDTV